MSQDDVTQYLIEEAVVVKLRKEDQDAEKKMQREQFKKDKGGFDKLRELAG